MRVSLEWLKEYVDIAGLAPEAIAEALTRSGLEVEHIDYQGPKFSGVVVAKVQAVAPHPNADKLRLVTVDLGPAGQTQVVCGAPNVREGIFIPFAQEGAAVINRKDGTLFTLGRAKIRGVESAGMCCSIDELGLEGQFEKPEDGIWPLDALVNNSLLGQDLKDALKLSGDVVLTVAPTANRGDLMSLRGVAREVAALFDRPLQRPEWQRLPENAYEKSSLQVQLADPSVCRYYGGVVLRNLKMGPAPEWMARRLQAAGVRSISNVVDITNYVMLEMGQPLHAFDLEKLGKQGVIGVRRAKDGEKLVTLDDVERPLTAESVVITMNDQSVALAGVMGGAATEIGDASREVFLESAYFASDTTRKSAKSVGLRSEASARFERGVDLDNCRHALERAVELLRQYAGAEFVRLIESPLPPAESKTITLQLSRMEKILGLSIDADTAARILKKLGFRLRPTQAVDSLVVEVPSFRQDDVYREIDLIEEVIRIYGYDRVPYTLPAKTASVPVSLRAGLLQALHRGMRAQGLQEVVTTSLIGENLLEKTGFSVNREQLVSVLNSHAADHTLLRQSLVPNLIEVARFNQAQGLEDVWIYELGRTYFKLGKANLKNAGVSERLHLSGLISGAVLSGRWHRQETADFYLAKGMLESLFDALGLTDAVSYAAAADVAWLHPGKTAKIALNGKDLGVLGELHPQQQESLKLRHPVYVFELNVEVLVKALKQARQNQSTEAIRISPFPAVRRDMAFLAPNTLTHGQIVDSIRKAQPEDTLLQEVSLFDEFRSEQLGADKRSLAYRLTFQSAEATLTDAEVDVRFNAIKDALSAALPIQFR